MKSNTQTNTVISSILRSLLIVLVIMICIQGCPPGSGTPKGKLGLWYQLNPNPQLWVGQGDFDVLDVQVVDDNFIVAVGTKKMFLRTTTSGNRWLPFKTLPSEGIRTVHFIDRKIGYAAGVPTQYEISTPGEYPKIWRTTDGGMTWENVLELDPKCGVGYKTRINDLYFTDENNGIAVGEGADDYGDYSFHNGFALWTNDGCQTWSWNYSRQLNAIDFASENLGIAVGGILGGVQYGGDTVGICMGSDISVIRTTQGITGQPKDCGQTSDPPLGWDDLSFNIQNGLGGNYGILNGISCPDDTTAYVTGAVQPINFYGIFGTRDAGETWDTILTTKGTPLLNVDFYDLCYPTPTEGTVVGSPGFILHNSPPPIIWKTQTSGTNVDLTCVDFISPDRGVIGGQGNTILTTRNGGESWEGPRSFTVKDLHAIEVLNNDFVAVCGDRGTIAISEDGGKTWCLQCTGSIRSLFDIAYVSPTSGITVGWHGCVFYTEDGQNWNIPESYPFSIEFSDPNHPHMNGVDFFTDTRAVAVGKNRLAITEDAGRNWTERSIPETVDAYTHLMDVACLDADHAVAVGCNGVILRTEDGGQTWNTVQKSIAKHLYGVYFPDSQYGWAVGYNNNSTSDFTPQPSQRVIIMHTQDGGLTWTEQTSGTETAQVLTDVHFIDRNTGIAVGGRDRYDEALQQHLYYKYILVTLDGGNTWKTAETPKAENLQGVRTFPDGRAYIAGSRGFIARTDTLSRL